ncbi:unnamed protein product, partial [Mesorhabditis belari]|uniref:Uncharacterized protein n=1 Tax=Mesorhabditis belari TaxID=2138241 RepID=A0AAF3EAC4_9BILA
MDLLNTVGPWEPFTKDQTTVVINCSMRTLQCDSYSVALIDINNGIKGKYGLSTTSMSLLCKNGQWTYDGNVVTTIGCKNCVLGFC